MKEKQYVIIAQNEIVVVDTISEGLLKLVDYDMQDKWATLYSYKDRNFSTIQQNKTFAQIESDLLTDDYKYSRKGE